MPNDAERKAVEKEIKEHGKTWCARGCPTFLPGAYRESRLVYGSSREVTQHDYDICHVFR
ncbi:MAG TPA: hypothetical protein VJJ22_05200 [Candidatus Paceibacterota bacterium]